CEAKLIPRRDPLDGALDATVVAIVKQQSADVFQVEETFLGVVKPGQTLRLPDFVLVVEDRSSDIVIAGAERTEPINADTRILIFLKPADITRKQYVRYGDWAIAGFGNCYFYTQNPRDLTELRSLAGDALELRHSWERARDIRDEWGRV